MYMPSISDLIALLALLLSAWALIVTTRFNRQQLALLRNQDVLAKRQLEMGVAQDALSKKANLIAELVKIDDRRWRVIVSNAGPATARNIRVVEANESALLVSNDVRAKLPYDLLEPGGQFQLLASVHYGTPSKVPLRINWDDEAKADNEKIVPVSF